VSSFLISGFSAGLFTFLIFFALEAMRFFGGFVMEEQIDQKTRNAMHTAITCHDSTTCLIMLKLGSTLDFRQMRGGTKVFPLGVRGFFH
jgi:hypothetical protein